MPIYEYRCVNCGARSEFIEKFSDEPKIRCEACKNPGLKRIMSKGSFHLKGSGWSGDGYGSSS